MQSMCKLGIVVFVVCCVYSTDGLHLHSKLSAWQFAAFTKASSFGYSTWPMSLLLYGVWPPVWYLLCAFCLTDYVSVTSDFICQTWVSPNVNWHKQICSCAHFGVLFWFSNGTSSIQLHQIWHKMNSLSYRWLVCHFYHKWMQSKFGPKWIHYPIGDWCAISTTNGTFNNKPFLVETGLYQFWLGLEVRAILCIHICLYSYVVCLNLYFD